MDFLIAAHTDVGIKKKINQDALLVKTAQTMYWKVLSLCDMRRHGRSGSWRESQRSSCQSF